MQADNPTAGDSDQWRKCSIFTISNREIAGEDIRKRPDLQTPCRQCGKPAFFVANCEENVATGEVRLGPIVVAGPCEACRKLEWEREAVREWKEGLAKVFPPLFMRTDPARLPQAQFKQAMDWRPTLEKPGLVLHGETGLCKTRVAILAAIALAERKPERRPLWETSWTPTAPTWMPAVTFSHEVQTRFGGDRDGPGWIDGLASRSIVILDDLGKGKLTERVQAELFGLLDARFSHGRATVITCNLAGDGLLQSFSADFGPPLVRRLREFCVAIGFKA